MISRILDQAEQSGVQGDIVVKSDRTTSLRFRDGRLEEAHEAEETGANLRLVVDERIGSAGTTTDDDAGLMDAALASARLGRAGSLLYPEAAPSGNPLVFSPDAESADIETLSLFGELLSADLASNQARVDMTLDRSVGWVHAANTRGVNVRYAVSCVTLETTTTIASSSGPTVVHAWWGQCGLPSDEDLDGIVRWVGERVRWAATEVTAATGTLPVCFTPRAMAALLTPLRHALGGNGILYGTSPLADRIEERVFDDSFTLIDDPWQDGRPGSRPIDDEGVVCRPIPLIENGVVKSGIFDLETAQLAGVPTTGHARRSTFGKPQPAYSNLRVLAGDQSWDDLLHSMGDGLVVDGFHGAGQGFARNGAFRQPASLSFKVSGGEIVGRTGPVTLSGNILSLLAQVRGLGREDRWLGSMCLPPVVLDGVRVAAG